MTQTQKLETILDETRHIQVDKKIVVEVIDEKTGLIIETITLPAGNYAIYKNYDLEHIGEIRNFVEDPNLSFNRLLRLVNWE